VLNGAGLEVVAEGEVAGYLEERVASGGLALPMIIPAVSLASLAAPRQADGHRMVSVAGRTGSRVLTTAMQTSWATSSAEPISDYCRPSRARQVLQHQRVNS